jgi:hypothetical protein
MVVLHRPKQVRKVGSNGCIPQCHRAAVTRGPLTLRWKREARTMHFCTFTHVVMGPLRQSCLGSVCPSHTSSARGVRVVVPISPTGVKVH